METNVRDKMLELFAKAGIGGDLEVADVPHGIAVSYQSHQRGRVKVTLTLCQSLFDMTLESESLAVNPQNHTQLEDFDVVGLLDVLRLGSFVK